MQQFGAQTTVLNVLLYKTKEVSNTKNINVNVTRPPTNIQLGRQGENLATCIIFDCSGLAQLYGDGKAELLHELKDGTIYPVAVTQDGASVSWTVSASDTAIVGSGRSELRWYVGDTLAKSAKFRTSVSSALADTTTETPPAPQQSWVDKVLAAAQEIKDGAISDEKLAEAIAAYLEEHPIDAGLDEAELVAYLVENGYLKNTDLADAITRALAEAKASGQFDGAPGKDGANGVDGQPGADGKDGADGITPNIQIGAVETLQAGNNATASITGTTENPLLNLGIPKGADGTSGKSAYQYAQDGGYTGTEADFAAKLAQEKFANPNALTFTGAVTGIYDGSSAVTVEIPVGGSGGSDAWSLIDHITAEYAAINYVIPLQPGAKEYGIYWEYIDQQSRTPKRSVMVDSSIALHGVMYRCVTNEKLFVRVYKGPSNILATGQGIEYAAQRFSNGGTHIGSGADFPAMTLTTDIACTTSEIWVYWR